MNRPLQKSPRATSTRLVAAACVIALLAACGSDESSATATATAPATDVVSATDADPTTGATPSDLVETAAAMVTEQAAAAGVELEPQCVAEAVALLNEADLALLAAAATQSSPDATIPALSPEGEAIGESISDCVVTNGDAGDVADAATVAEAVAFVVSQEGEAIDQVCLTEQFSALGVEELRVLIDEGSATDNPLAERPFMAVWECFVDEDTSSIDTTTTQEVVPTATEAQPVTAVETPMGWPAGVPVLSSPDFYISADPAPAGQFDVIMRTQAPAIFQSAVDSWAASIGLGCIVDLQVTEAQPCRGALPDGSTISVLVDQEALYSPNPRFSLLVAAP